MVRIKVLKCCAGIFFKLQCLARKIVPNYANVKVPVTSPASHRTRNKIHTIRLKDEIKCLYSRNVTWLYILYWYIYIYITIYIVYIYVYKTIYIVCVYIYIYKTIYIVLIYCCVLAVYSTLHKFANIWWDGFCLEHLHSKKNWTSCCYICTVQRSWPGSSVSIGTE